MNIKQTLQRGFTLIELLVVIAIIGILAAVVLASLNDARSSGTDAAIQQSLGNVRSQAEIVYNRNGAFSYADVCADPQVIQLEGAADTSNGTGNTYCSSDASNWVMAADLVSVSSSSVWCVDSTGQAGRIAALPTTGVACP